MFEVTDKDIANLDDATLRTLVALLCEAECRRRNLSTSYVTWGGDQNAADDGIDVAIDLPDDCPIEGYIPRPKTGYQVKAQDMPKNQIDKEMAPNGNLRPSIFELSNQDGAYIIVSSQGSVAKPALTRRRNAMATTANPAYESGSLDVDFYDRQRLASWVNEHFGLVIWTREKVGRSLQGWSPFRDWSSSPSKDEDEYILDDQVRIHGQGISESEGITALKGIERIRNVLSEARGSARLVGLSGVGKTRLVQALFDERVGQDALAADQAIYADVGGDAPSPLPLDLLALAINEQRKAVLIVDNCGAELHRKLTQQLRQNNTTVSLVTIEYDITDDEPESTDVFRLKPSSTELVEKILERRFPTIGSPNIRTIANFSDGNARIAIALASTVDKGESLTNLKDSVLFNRLFYQNKKTDKELLTAAKICSLVYSFDGETIDGPEAELPILAELAELSLTQLHTQVAELKRRQLVQSRGKWRAVLPHAVAHRLARLALEEIPLETLKAAFADPAPVRIVRSLTHRLGYLHDVGEAQSFASAIVERGEFNNLADLNKDSIDQLRNIAPINPPATLALIQRGAVDSQFFTGSNKNKNQIVQLIRSLAYDSDLFDQAAQLLVHFAANEELEDHNSKALSILVSMFHLFLSGVQADASQRASFVKRLLQSEDAVERAIAIQLLSAMLKTGHFSSHYGFEFGARSRNYGWRPKTFGEQWNWYEISAELAYDATRLENETSEKARAALADNFRGLFGQIPDVLLGIARKILVDDYWPEGWLAVRTTLGFDGKHMEDKKRVSLLELEKLLGPQDLATKVLTHALSRQWGSIDIADSDPLAERDPAKAHERIEEKCRDLGRQLASEEALLERLLPDILTAKSTRTWSLGRGLAERTTSLELTWAKLTKAALNIKDSKRQMTFLSGFLLGAHERNQLASEKILDLLLEDAAIRQHFPYLQSALPVTESALDRILGSFDFDDIPLNGYMNFRFFRFEDDETHANPPNLENIFDHLLAKDGGATVACEIFQFFLHGKDQKKMPITSVDKRIGRKILATVTFSHGRESSDYHLAEIINVCLSDPSAAAEARTVARRIVTTIQSHDAYPGDFPFAITALARQHPDVVLDELVEEAQFEGSRITMFSEIREFRDCPLDEISIQKQLDWAEIESATRYSALASNVRIFVQDKDTKALSWSPIALKLISNARDPIDVLERFYQRFEPSSWSGSLSAMLEERLPLFDQLTEFGQPIVKSWVKQKLPQYRILIEDRKTWDVRDYRDRDERFE